MRRAVRAIMAVSAIGLAACGQGSGRGIDALGLIDSDAARPLTEADFGSDGAPPADGVGALPDGVVAGRGASSAQPGSRRATGAVSGDSGSVRRAAKTTSNGPPLQLGVFYPNDGGAAYAAFGVNQSDAQGGDPSSQVVRALQAMTTDINARGGLGGRKMELVLHGAPLVTNDTWTSQGQAACAKFTEDHRVFAALLMINGNLTVSECLADRKVVVLESRNIVYDRHEFDRTGIYVYSARGMNLSRQGPWLEELGRGGYFDKGAKVGVLTIDDETHERSMDEVVRPTLHRMGVAISEVGYLSSLNATADAGHAGAQISNIVLRFKTAGITHVVFWGTQGVGPFFFPTTAENQNYRPRYGISTQDYPELSRNQGPRAQWRRAVGAGWAGPGDVGLAPNWVPDDLGNRCFKFFTDEGLAVTTGDTANGLLSLCDSLWFLKAGMDAADAATPQAFRAAVDSLGNSFASAGGTPNTWGPGKHDGAGGVRRFAFDDGCECFKYTSPTWTAVP